MEPITEFRGKYYFLSNFYESPFVFSGLEFKNAEAAFHSAKVFDIKDKLEFVSLNASDAKRLGRRVKLRPDWEEVKDGIMKKVITAKFSDPKLRNMLLETHTATLIEGNSWGDTYWGVSNGKGLNKLGKILMEVREEIKNK